jgi:hypothetical protein
MLLVTSFPTDTSKKEEEEVFLPNKIPLGKV